MNDLECAPDRESTKQTRCDEPRQGVESNPFAVRDGAPPSSAATPAAQEDPTCMQARLVAEHEMHRRRAAHVGFQGLLADAAIRDAELGCTPDCRLHLNPIRVWARLDRAMRIQAAQEPFTEVLFFAAGNAIRAAVLEPKARALLNVLAWFSPCTLCQFWALNKHSSRAEIERFCRDLAQVGLIAFS